MTLAAVSAIRPEVGVPLAGAVAYWEPAAMRLAERASRARAEHVTRMLDVASQESGYDRDTLVDRISRDDQRLIVALDAVQAAASTTMREKLPLLGTSLGRLAADDIKVDRERLIIQALASLEEPHVHVLDVIASPPPLRRRKDGELGGRADGWPPKLVAQALPQYEGVARSLVAVLAAQGLVQDVVAGAFLREGGPGPHRYKPTALGTSMLELLRQQGAPGSVFDPGDIEYQL